MTNGCIHTKSEAPKPKLLLYTPTTGVLCTAVSLSCHIIYILTELCTLLLPLSSITSVISKAICASKEYLPGIKVILSQSISDSLQHQPVPTLLLAQHHATLKLTKQRHWPETFSHLSSNQIKLK